LRHVVPEEDHVRFEDLPAAVNAAGRGEANVVALAEVRIAVGALVGAWPAKSAAPNAHRAHRARPPLPLPLLVVHEPASVVLS
jgi:hypothetical protein